MKMPSKILLMHDDVKRLGHKAALMVGLIGPCRTVLHYRGRSFGFMYRARVRLLMLVSHCPLRQTLFFLLYRYIHHCVRTSTS